jgi:hypothetical protein
MFLLHANDKLIVLSTILNIIGGFGAGGSAGGRANDHSI